MGVIIDMGKYSSAVRESFEYIRGNVIRGVGANQTLRDLRAAGMGGRDSQLKEVHRLLKQAYLDKEVYLPTDKSLKPNEAFIPCYTKNQMERYNYIVEWAEYDYDIMDMKSGHKTVTTMELLSQEYVEQQVNELLREGTDFLSVGVAHIEVVEIRKSLNPTLVL